MLVATPGQTTAYTTTLHNNNNSSNGGGSGGVSGTAVVATSTSKKSTSINSTNAAVSATPKSLNNNNNHSASMVISKNSINSNTHNNTASYNYIQNPKINQNKTLAATSSREIISSSVSAATNTHSLKNKNSTNNTKNTTTTINSNTTSTKQQSFIQTLKDSVQKALISTTGGSSNNLIAHKLTAENKLQNNCNNSSTSIQNVTSSSSSTSHNANKVSTTTTTSSNNSGNSAAATQSSSSASLVRSKYFSCSLSKLHTVAPTIIHRYPEERQNASSTDSLQKEMCHFKPIRIVPTTPWKSGSKSRGNSLRFPKANLATKNSEFVLKSNCDVNNRKKKQQQNRAQNDKIDPNEENAADINEQENKEFYGIYKPKPSLTCLSTSVTTPNHQSAFVCLVAQMKSLVNLQSKKQSSPLKTVATGEDLEEPIKELFVRRKSAKKSFQQKEVEQELPKSRTTRLTLNADKNKNTTTTTTTTNNLKAKSRRKQGRAKSKKVINIVVLAKSKVTLENSKSMPAVVSKRTRKRKHDDNDEGHEEAEITSVKSLAPIARKSSRLSKDMTSPTSKLFKNPGNKNSQQATLKTPHKSRKNPRTVVCFSPPLTRSRLKRLAEQDLFTK